MLYFATIILAHRPFWAVPSHYRTCMDAAACIEKLVNLLDTTFGLDNITYLMGYCIYTGASAVLEHAKKNSGINDATLQTFIRALNSAKEKNPILKRSLDIIIKGLDFVSTRNLAPDSQSFHLPQNSYIPAFPSLDPSWPLNLDMETAFSGMDMDPMAFLDCYPELQLGLGDAS
jgi:hypothetical protein